MKRKNGQEKKTAVEFFLSRKPPTIHTNYTILICSSACLYCFLFLTPPAPHPPFHFSLSLILDAFSSSSFMSANALRLGLHSYCLAANMPSSHSQEKTLFTHSLSSARSQRREMAQISAPSRKEQDQYCPILTPLPHSGAAVQSP